MSWKDKLQTASFRGVPFEVDGEDRDAGRRTQTHTFVGRDDPYTEDLGRKADEFSVEAFVCGPDWMDRRDALLDACNEAGPGTLVLPWDGSREVVCTGVRRQHSKADGGVCRFSLRFVIAGRADSPSATVRTDDAVRRRAELAQAASATGFDNRFSVDGMPSWGQQTSLEKMQTVIDKVEKTRTIVGKATDFYAKCSRMRSITDLSGMSLGTDLVSLFQDFGDVSGVSLSGLPLPTASLPGGSLPTVSLPSLSAAGTSESAQYMAKFNQMLELSASVHSMVAPNTPTPTALAVARNVAALGNLQREASVAEMARTAASIVPATTRDAARMRDTVLSALDVVLETTEDDAVFTAYTDLRTATVHDMAQRARGAAVIDSYTPPQPMNALQVAQIVHGTGGAVAEIVARNPVRHPGFMNESLEVLR